MPTAAEDSHQTASLELDSPRAGPAAPECSRARLPGDAR